MMQVAQRIEEINEQLLVIDTTTLLYGNCIARNTQRNLITKKIRELKGSEEGWIEVKSNGMSDTGAGEAPLFHHEPTVGKHVVLEVIDMALWVIFLLPRLYGRVRRLWE